MFSFTRSRPVLGAAVIAVAVGCADQATVTTPTARSLSASAFASRQVTPTSGRHVFVSNGNASADFASRVAARGGAVVSSMPGIGVFITEGLSDADASIVAGKDAVTRDYDVQWLTPDVMQLSNAVVSDPIVSDEAVAPAKSPLTAAFLAFQWNMAQISAPQTWTAVPATARKARVAILDSGLDPDHIDQRGLIDVALSKAYVPSVAGPPDWADDNMHGTSVGNIVTSNNFGTAGVAPNVTLVAVKVLGADGAGPLGAVIAGIYYATDVAKVDVINMSLGAAFPKNDPGISLLQAALNRAVNYAHAHGVLVVSAAGNEFTDLQHNGNFVELPCEAGVQICVSATGNGDTHASYSNFGVSSINVAAPGGDGPPSAATWIIAPCSSRNVNPAFQNCKNRVSYIIETGTSASAPHVSGLGAYIASQYAPGQLSASQLITLIQQTSDDIGKPGTDPFFGKGRINVFNAVTQQ